MMKLRFWLIGLFICLLPCAAVEGASLALDENQSISFYLPEPNHRTNTQLDVAGQSVDAIVLASNQGVSAFFISLYGLPKVASEYSKPEDAIEREINRCVANVEGQIISRRILDIQGHLAVEVIVKSPKNKVLTVKCWIICDSHRIFSLTAITTDGKGDESPMIGKFFSEFRIEKAKSH